MKKTNWKEINARLQYAEKFGEEISGLQSKATLPIDPFSIARSERPLLKVVAENFGEAFDGQLEYHRKQNRFILFLNTKYDAGVELGEHHARTRFSLAHEFGHYSLEVHRAYLMGGGKSHASTSEFRSDQIMEREADAFAAGLLMPSRLVRPIINRAEPSFDRIVNYSTDFQTSIVSTAIRTVQLSDFPCAIGGIKEGCLTWLFLSEPLIESGCYPKERGDTATGAAAAQWEEFRMGFADRHMADGAVQDWFRTYDREHLDNLYVSEEYFPVPVMGTLLVLLSISEGDLFEDEDD